MPLGAQRADKGELDADCSIDLGGPAGDAVGNEDRRKSGTVKAHEVWYQPDHGVIVSQRTSRRGYGIFVPAMPPVPTQDSGN